ncbi:MAG: hypothetical protein KIS68_07990 [Bauldia sp.]|nr:hypothetical protein [Bauldia sp.]
MTLVRTFAAATAAAVLIAPQAYAQATTDEQIATIVLTWIAEEAADMDPVAQEYGVGCLTPLVQALAEPTKLVIIAAGGMEAGIVEIEATDAATYDTMFPPLQLCIEAMFVGETIWPWVQVMEATRPLDEQKLAAFCVMDAIKPLTTEQKQTLYLAAVAPDADFEDGLDALVLADPTLEPMLQAAIEPCV